MDYIIEEGVLIKYYGQESEIKIPDGVREIGSGAFRNNPKLKTVMLSDSVVKISDSAFRFCKSLEKIILSENLEIISDNAFALCSELKEVTVSHSIKEIGNYAFYKCESLETVILPENLTVLGNYAFAYCSAVTDLIIPCKVNKIGFEAFSNCISLKSVTLSDGVQAIDKYAFRYCINLDNLILPRTLKSIGAWAFYNCHKLTDIILPESVTELGSDCFAHCISLEKILVEEQNPNYKSIEGVLFTKDGSTILQYPLGNFRTSYLVPGRVKNIEKTSFYNSVNLVEVHISENVVSIGIEAFRNCQKLETAVIIRGHREGITAGARDMFADCNKNFKILVPSESISFYKKNSDYLPYSSRIAANIKTFDFWGNNGMIITDERITNYKGLQETVIIPNNITAIMPEAFFGKENVKSIVFENGSKLTCIGEAAFRDCTGLLKIALPSSLEYLSERVFLNCRNLFEVTLPENINEISDELFENCINLKTVKIPNSVISIGREAFCAAINLKTVFIPKGVNNIGKEAFRNCTGLEKITVEDNNCCFKSIDGVLFDKECKELIQYPQGNIKISYIVPSSVSTIGEYSFAVTKNLVSVIIPESVKEIRAYGFAWCNRLSQLVVNRKAKDTITLIEPSALRGFHKELKIYVPKDSLEIYKRAEGWREYTGNIFPKD